MAGCASGPTRWPDSSSYGSSRPCMQGPLPAMVTIRSARSAGVRERKRRERAVTVSSPPCHGDGHGVRGQGRSLEDIALDEQVRTRSVVVGDQGSCDRLAGGAHRRSRPESSPSARRRHASKPTAAQGRLERGSMIGSRAGRALTAPVIAFACVLLGFTTAPVADAAVCATHFIGLHGVGEGTESATIVVTIKAAGAADGDNNPPVEYEALDYPTLTIQEFLSQQFLGSPSVTPIVVGATILNQRIKELQAREAATGCRSKFLLVGYSEGAWVIDFYANGATGKGLLPRMSSPPSCCMATRSGMTAVVAGGWPGASARASTHIYRSPSRTRCRRGAGTGMRCAGRASRQAIASGRRRCVLAHLPALRLRAGHHGHRGAVPRLSRLSGEAVPVFSSPRAGQRSPG
jgi:hypothetical protein